MQVATFRGSCGLYEQTLGTVRERVGAGVFERWFAAGHSLAAADIVAEALGSSEPRDASAGRTEASPAYAPLSAQEWEVSRLVARGLKNRDIAEQLVLAERTVSSHLERIFAKLRMSSRARLSAWVTERAVVSAPIVSAASPATQPEQAVTGVPERRSRRRLHVVGK